VKVLKKYNYVVRQLRTW